MTADRSDPSDSGSGLERARFSISGTSSSLSAEGFRDLGITPLARQLGLSMEQTNGHWCSQCEGIWFGYTLEVQCPVCGSRKG